MTELILLRTGAFGSDAGLGSFSFAEAKRPVNLCKPSPCMNEGTCILKDGSYRCECRGAWEGPHCEAREWILLFRRGGGGLLHPAKVYRRQAESFNHVFIPL